MSIIFTLMAVFSKIALGAFGGGLATIPFIHHELVVIRPWLTEEMFRQTISLAQMTPGPIALNAATFVGYRLGGFWGSFWTTVALVGTPVLVIIILIWLISIASKGAQSKVEAFQKALRPAVAGMLVSAFWTLAKPLVPQDFSSLRVALSGFIPVGIVIFCILLSRIKIFRSYPQLLIFTAAILGLCLKDFLV